MDRYRQKGRYFSLKDIILRDNISGVERVRMEQTRNQMMIRDQDSFTNDEEMAGSSEVKDKVLLLQRLDLTLNGKECQLINFRDITSMESMQKIKETNRVLRMLTTTVSHQIIQPL